MWDLNANSQSQIAAVLLDSVLLTIYLLPLPWFPFDARSTTMASIMCIGLESKMSSSPARGTALFVIGMAANKLLPSQYNWGTNYVLLTYSLISVAFVLSYYRLSVAWPSPLPRTEKSLFLTYKILARHSLLSNKYPSSH